MQLLGSYGVVVDAAMTLRQLATTASLPPVVSTRSLPQRGFDNELLHATLSDGREVVLRQNAHAGAAPMARAAFLADRAVGAPRLYAANDSGAVLVEFIPGITLAAAAQCGTVGDREWRLVGQAYRRIHAVTFPSPLRGDFGPQSLVLTPTDVVELLHTKVDAAEPAVRDEQPGLLPQLSKLRRQIDAHADELRREVPCLAHTDANFHNLILGRDEVRLIDWDYPAVRYPLEELEALEEHAYLNGVPELPADFFIGYGRDVSRPLLRLHRIAGCLGHIGSNEWTAMAVDPRNPPELRAMLTVWDRRLREWILRLGEHLAEI